MRARSLPVLLVAGALFLAGLSACGSSASASGISGVIVDKDKVSAINCPAGTVRHSSFDEGTINISNVSFVTKTDSKPKTNTGSKPKTDSGSKPKTDSKPKVDLNKQPKVDLNKTPKTGTSPSAAPSNAAPRPSASSARPSASPSTPAPSTSSASPRGGAIIPVPVPVPGNNRNCTPRTASYSFDVRLDGSNREKTVKVSSSTYNKYREGDHYKQ